MDRGAPVLYVSRLVKLPLLDSDGATIGRVDDLVIGPPARGSAPLLLGLVANVNRRRIFVAASRIGDVDGAGIRLKPRWTCGRSSCGWARC